MEVPTLYIIHDIRMQKDFKGITICGYKRKDVTAAFENSMINNNLEDAIRWCSELHSTGLNNVIWNSIKNIYIKYIHINNPKFFFYILKREKDYNNIIQHYQKKHEIFTRNNQEIRNLYAELTAISSLTKKNNLFLPKSLPIINSKSFEKNEIKKRMISRNFDNIIEYIYNSTTKEIKLGLNEILTNLSSKHGTFQNCLYWYLWLEKLEKLQKDEDKIILTNNINRYDTSEVNNKFFDHWTTILWNIILSFKNYLDKNNLILLKKIHHVYKKNFKLSEISKKKYYFFIVFYILKENINWNINIFNNEYLIIQSNANINKMYKNIIKNIESNLSFESKDYLYKKYNKLYQKQFENKITLKKIKDTNLTDDINKVVYTDYPEYKILNKNEFDFKENNYENNNKTEKLIKKNMNLQDIIDSKEVVKDKKINAFREFFVYKKNSIQKEKNVLDYYIENTEDEFKNINFSNKKSIL